MGVQGYCTLLTIPAPLAHSGGGTSSLRVHVVATIQVVWADGVTDTIHRGSVLSAYGGGTVVDGSTLVWLVVASRGASHLWLVQEVDYPTMAAVGALAGDWAVLFRVDGDMLYRVPQI